ncbi:MAG: hypothetical protein JNM00_03945, partial [Flavobacteriales bacterium]|nr:hypothetical protein [Flavobacteriales bacterium]
TLGNPIPGCTDPSACNYDATATCEDYSCCYQCYYLYTYDEFEDGWNGATMNITSTGTGDFSGVYTNGPDTDYELLVGCVTDGCYEVNVTSVDFPSEITWDLYYYEVFGDGFMYVAGGGAPYNDYVGIDGDCCPGCPNADACNYTVFAEGHSASCCYQNCGSLYLYDSFGDGWNGGYVTITDANGNIAHQTSLGAGDSGYEVTCLADGCYTVEVTAGSFSSEVSLYYADWYNYVYVTPGAPASISVGNIITGCMDPTAINYDPLANCPGDCTTTCPADLDGNGVVNVGDLLLFTASFGTFCY